MLQAHRALGTWRDRVTLYLVLNSSCRQHFVRGGIPAEKIRVKPNFTREPGVLPSGVREGLLFVGRLSPEKGVQVLIDAQARCANLPLRIVGDGPLAAGLPGLSGVALDGPLPAHGVQAAMAAACALVVPSVWPEMFGLVVIEAYAAGLPVIASRIGALSELVEDGITGLLVEPGDAKDLAEKMLWASANPDRMATMGMAARQRYEQLYTPAANARALQAIYREAMQLRRAG
jgi:glycosyltransferase involved in cell wall biosynthesis